MGKEAIREGMERWAERWAAKSDSGHGDYIVCKDNDGKYACSCRGWTLHMYCPVCGNSVKKAEDYCWKCRTEFSSSPKVRGDCKHITRAKRGSLSLRPISQAVLERLLA